jgi:hypothetical protein
LSGSSECRTSAPTFSSAARTSSTSMPWRTSAHCCTGTSTRRCAPTASNRGRRSSRMARLPSDC